MEANMDRFVRNQNVERYRRLIESVSEDGSLTETKRQTVLTLLAEEQQMQKDAGDKI
jgi:hypothetical protein